MKCWHSLHVNELSDADLDRHQEACDLMLLQFPTNAEKKKVMFSVLYIVALSVETCFSGKKERFLFKKLSITHNM